jgi:hypothetical protein
MMCRRVIRSAAAASLLVLTACAGDVNPVRDVAVGLGAGPPPAKTPDFVQQSRPANLDYIPIAPTTPPRPTKPRTADEVKAAEAEMDALRSTNETAASAARKAGATPAPAPASGPARGRGKPKPKPADPTRP